MAKEYVDRCISNGIVSVRVTEGNNIVITNLEKDIEVYNAMGQRVMMVETIDNAIQLNTANLSNGMYVVRIYANDGTVLNRTFSVAR